MAKRGDPRVLRLVVIFLRSLARMTQAQFGRECGITQANLSRYEWGKIPPSEKVLRRMAKVAGIDWLLVAHLRQFYTSLLAVPATRNAAPSTPPDLKALEPVLLAVTPYLIEVQSTEPARASREEEHDQAEQIWAVLDKHPVGFSRRLIDLSPRSGSWALAVRACEASTQRAAHDANEALELAELALSLAERAPGEPGWLSRLQGYCWAHVANARRVGSDLFGADQAFAHAWDLWRAGAVSKPEALPEWRLLSLEASLRRAERRFSAALELLDQALALSKGEPLATTQVLMKKDSVLHQMGKTEDALKVLAEAGPLVELSRDQRMLFALQFKITNHLCHLERFNEAAELLPQVRELAAQQGNRLDLIRVDWLSSRVATGQGRTEEAIAGLQLVSRDFAARNLPYDAALASLDLAVLYLKEGRTGEVQSLALEIAAIFKAHGIARETFASLALFCEAAAREAATVELARQAMAEINGARGAGRPG